MHQRADWSAWIPIIDQMPTFLLVLSVTLGAIATLLLLLFLLYLFVLVRPRGKAPADKALSCDYAHRGLHGDGVPENSLAAFSAACEAGYGIELDVQLSSDGEIMVFHDYTLARMTGDSRKLSDVSAAELAALKLAGIDEHIPTFSEVLATVDGRVPLLVELKGESADTTLCPKVAEMLKNYDGSYCIESFNPILLRAVEKQLPDAYCGLLYTNVVRDKRRHDPLHIIIATMSLNRLCKPHFIAFNEIDRHAIPVKLATHFYRTPKFVWTVRGREAIDRAHACGEQAIFEYPDRP